jgi:hypothetical protein
MHLELELPWVLAVVIILVLLIIGQFTGNDDLRLRLGAKVVMADVAVVAN